uniref:Uncharacterized protein n=1 Tax=Rhizophora mucronata TaxID=61149 RepID=A0A2P2N3D3_RHIMU
MMALLANFFGCFSNSSKVGCEGDQKSRGNKPKNEQSSGKLKKNMSKNRPPVPVTYFPVGARFSYL